MTEPTARELRLQPRLIVHTGDGEGKSTAAFGMALRAWAQGWSVGVHQFVKSAAWTPGERVALERLGASWTTWGAGRTGLRATRDADHAELARQGWRQVRRELAAEIHRFYVLDEFTYPLDRGWVEVAEVLDTLAGRPGIQHVVITGRRCPAAVVDAADLVTEMTKITHPFDTGAKGQAGIEW